MTGELQAGPFSSWLARAQAAQRDDVGADVPCGSCTACCRSSYFIHIGPDEVRTLRRIPRQLLVPAPGRPGHVVMGYDESGHCPMLVDDRCSIYADRPRTCRRFDCRVFPAAGLDAADDGKPAIAAQAVRWRFDVSTARDRAERDALRAAAAYLRDRAGECFPDGAPPMNGELAVLALRVHRLFLGPAAEPDVAAVRRALGIRARSGAVPDPTRAASPPSRTRTDRSYRRRR